MQEIAVKSHLIITDIHNEYHMNWCGKIRDVEPLFDEQGRPIFAIVSSESRIEVCTTSMTYLEECAKKITRPKGRSAVSADRAYIYIKTVDRDEKLMGILTHNRVKTFAPMYDKVGWS
jgi:hypothetical protein